MQLTKTQRHQKRLQPEEKRKIHYSNFFLKEVGTKLKVLPAVIIWDFGVENDYWARLMLILAETRTAVTESRTIGRLIKVVN